MSTWTNPTTVDLAAQIRATLKRLHGWTARDVSVVSDCYSMGSTLRIRIKNPRVPLSRVEAIANPAESIDRDQWGEILSGRNRFVDVSYTREASDAHVDAWIEVVQEAMGQRGTAGDQSLIPVAGTPYLIGRDAQRHTWSLWSRGNHGRHLCDCMDADGLARQVGARMAEREPAA